MHSTKKQLLKLYGQRCMMCRRKMSYKKLQWHHIKPRYVSHQANEPPDNTVENGALLCLDCHVMIHEYLWGDDEFQLLTEIILRNKASSQ